MSARSTLFLMMCLNYDCNAVADEIVRQPWFIVFASFDLTNCIFKEYNTDIIRAWQGRRRRKTVGALVFCIREAT